MSTPVETGSMSWISLLAASSQLMNEKVKGDSSCHQNHQDYAVTNLLQFESPEGEAPASTVIQKPLEQKDSQKESSTSSKKLKSTKTLRYIRGIPSVSKRDIAWNIMFKRLQMFKHATGHCNVPQGFTTDLELATWVKNQRQAYRYMLDNKKDKKPTKRISQERVNRLNQLGFEWRKYVRADELKNTLGARSTPRQKCLLKQGFADRSSTPRSWPAANSNNSVISAVGEEDEDFKPWDQNKTLRTGL